MTAGARSLFMLAKISKAYSYNKLVKEFGLTTDKPTSMLDHWYTFRELSQHPNFGQPWETEILFFSKAWFEQLDDEAFTAFQRYLYKNAWESSNYIRHQFIWNLVFSLIQKEMHIKPAPYIANTVKHLIAMGIGALPGYAPAIDDIAGPISQLQHIFSNIYGLKSYAPIIMQPYHFNVKDDRPVYYSLHYPNTLEFSIKSRLDSSKLADLILVKSLLRKYLNNLVKDYLHVEETPLYELPNLVKYDFFHNEFEDYTDIMDTKVIGLEDKHFSLSQDQQQLFPANSPFLTGCVRIARKK